MGRKSLAGERTNQIIDAFEQCIIEYGFEGATLQRTADLAELNLGMIYHYIGRKTDLLKAMVGRLTTRIEEEMAEFHQQVPDKKRLSLLLTYFFDDQAEQEDRVVEALYTTGSDNTAVQEALDQINKLYASIWAAEIGRIHPHLSADRCTEVAFTVLGLAYASELLPSAAVRTAIWRQAAETLIRNP